MVIYVINRGGLITNYELIMRGNLPACKVLRTCTQHTQRARENAMLTMLELFTQYQQALYAGQ